jgi:hypothetical protein
MIDLPGAQFQAEACIARADPAFALAYCTIVMLDVLLILIVFFLINGMMSG